MLLKSAFGLGNRSVYGSYLMKKRSHGSSSTANFVLNNTPSKAKLKKKLESELSLKDFMQKSPPIQLSSEEKLENEIFLKTLKRTQAQAEHEEERSSLRKRKVFFEVHGCQMNTNDTEIAYSILDKTGLYERTVSERDADVILLMTCSIRENAEQKIWNRMRDFAHLKNRKKHLQIGILGCMAERLKEKIVDKEKLVDIICGPDSYRVLPTLLDQSSRSGNVAMNVQLSFEETYAEISPLRINENKKTAFVSIQRGCDNMCSFCIVPFVRGRERSRPIASILDEIRQLSDQGIKEVTLLGQNVNSYQDMSEKMFNLNELPAMSKGFKTIYKPKKGGRRFVDLLDAVSRINPEIRVRFTSPHPKDFPNDLLYLMKERPNIAKTIHLPAQSGSTTCLERMRRGYTREAYLDLVEQIRAILPDVALTSDFIAGFCGETEHEHKDTITLMKKVNYTYCFMYTYSMREKTKAHHRMSDDVPNEVKNRRYLEMVDTFRQTATELNTTKLNQLHLVLIDTLSKRSELDYSGRNDNNTIVVFPKRELPFISEDLSELNDLDAHKRMIMPQIGDYVVCKLMSCTSQSFKAVPLYACNLQTFDKIKQEHQKQQEKGFLRENQISM